MTSALATSLEEISRQEFASAIRVLLLRPLVRSGDDEEALRNIVRHQLKLAEWFLDQTGWKLVVDARAGFARLHKIPGHGTAARPARSRNGLAFDRRRYALLCLILATLEEGPVQTTIARLAQNVVEQSADEPDITSFDPDSYHERRAFVDALRMLENMGVLSLRDGAVDRYAHNPDADALYDVDERLLRQLISAPIPPAMAGKPERLLEELYPEAAEGERQMARHGIFRRLLDDPVLYLDDLTVREREWLEHSRGFIYQKLEDDAGLLVEKRREGLAAVDPQGEVTDELFPHGGSTVKHAALLLCEQLAYMGRMSNASPIPHEQVEEIVSGLIDGYAETCGWSKAYPHDEDGVRRLARDACDLLARFKLVEPSDDGIRPRPAIARFAPSAPRQQTIPGGPS